MTLLLTADEPGIAHAAALLRRGELVAFGTETVYGLGADATQPHAIASLYAAKARPQFNPLIIHSWSAYDAFANVIPTRLAERLAEAFWPGPLTLILPRRPHSRVDLLAGAGLNTLAVRVPGHKLARALLQATGTPIAAPSANRSGAISPTTSAHVQSDLAGRIAAILDCGPTPIGVESTVLDLTTPRPTLLRPGGLPREALLDITGPLAAASNHPEGHSQPRGPGLLASHYAPRLPLRLNATSLARHEALLAFGPTPLAASLCWNLSATANLQEAAARLYAGLHWLDAQAPRHNLTSLAAMAIPPHDLGAAINDRLHRAAAPKPKP